MIEDFFAISILVSLAAVPLVLWLGRRKVYDVFHTQGKWTILLSCVVALNIVAAIVHLGFGVRVSGVNELCWAGILFLVFIWIRTLALLTQKVST
ncbi:hypothetical protein Enr10x_02340 [Gimesia panareensis]|uniref:Uncharacterized protein n=1 Tax=Gimesia panareensis TaxID=2527978 RepID=A0A517PZY3_9PLAN|nr:hypothetical protein [Gimesia panareensis]QDT24940.1 hypothetical protein Enr10x_02340 [Gimesia panareensis]